MRNKDTGIKIVAQNKKARHLYELMDFVEAGISLTGPEVKSVRAGKVSFKDGYVKFAGGEAFLTGVHIAPYDHAAHAGQDPDRDRKLLLHAREIKNLAAKVDQKGLTVVPTRMYLKKGRIKVEIALAKGKKVHDRREEIKRRDIERDMARQMAKY